MIHWGVLWRSSGQDSVISLLWPRIQSLVGELMSCKPCGTAKKKKKKSHSALIVESSSNYWAQLTSSPNKMHGNYPLLSIFLYFLFTILEHQSPHQSLISSLYVFSLMILLHMEQLIHMGNVDSSLATTSYYWNYTDSLNFSSSFKGNSYPPQEKLMSLFSLLEVLFTIFCFVCYGNG